MSRPALLQAYDAHAKALPQAARRTCASVLFNCVQAIQEVNGAKEDAHVTQDAPNEVIVGDSLVALPQQGSNATFTSLLAAERKAVRAVAEMGKDIILLQASDTRMLESACRAVTLLSEDTPAAEAGGHEDPLLTALQEFEYRAQMRKQVPLLLRGKQPEPKGFPLVSDSGMVLSVNEAELRTFCGLPVSARDMYTFNQMQEADELIKAVSQPLPDFTKSASRNAGVDSLVLGRRYYQYLSASSLAQVFSSEALKEPTVLQKYYPATDELIYLLHWPPPRRRMSVTDWAPADNMSNKVPGDKVGGLPNLEAFQQDSVQITPAGKAIVLAKQLYSTGAAWISVHLDGAVFGLRCQNDMYNYAKSRGLKPARRGVNATAVADADEQLEPQQDPEVEVEVEQEPIEGEEEEEAEEEGGEEGEEELEKEAPEATPEPEPVPEPEPDVASPAAFVYEDEDSSRVVIHEGPAPKKPKPDKYGTTMMTHTDMAGLSTVACSNGTLRFYSSIPGSLHNDTIIGEEISRTIAPEATISRKLRNGPYIREVLCRNGDRILYRNIGFNGKFLEKGFHSKLLKDAPSGWSFIRLNANGKVLFYTSITQKQGIPHATFKDIRTVSIDAETKAIVASYIDGRTVVSYTDGLLDVSFSDGTKCITVNNLISLISKKNLPTVEVDLELDAMCIGHAIGKQVSIAKGGLRVRSRVALTDGSAMMVKYNTSITAECNGSLKLVKRDGTVIMALDTGVVTLSPKTAWDAAALAEFKDEAKDAYALPVPPGTAELQRVTSAATATIKMVPSDTSLLVHGGANDRVNQSVTFEGENLSQATRGTKSQSTVLSPQQQTPACPYDDAQKTSYNFNVLKQSCLIEDYEYNRFEIKLSNIQEPIVDLAGEVEGLKPEAVTDKPLAPRLFIIKRTAEATEIISDDKVIDLSRIAWYSPDVERRSGVSPPTGPGGLESTEMQLHGGRGHAESKASRSSEVLLNYDSFHSRVRLGRYDDIYTFEEIFAERPWRDRTAPAVASLDMKMVALKNAKNGQVSARPPIAANIYKVHSFTERQPLSANGYEQLRSDLQKWKTFCEERVASIDRFAVGDFRSDEEQKEEEALQKRITQIYKDMSKEMKRRAKDEKARKDALEYNESDKEVHAEPEPEPERMMTAETDEDSSVVKRKHAANRAAAVAEAHIVDAFEQFAEENDRGGILLHYSSIPLALIQMFATHVDYHLIDLALAEMGMNQRSPRGNNPGAGGYSATTLSLHEFRSMQGHVRMLLKVREEEELARRRRELLPPQAPSEDLSHSASSLKSKAKRIQTGPARLQKSEDDAPIEIPALSAHSLHENQDAFDGKGVNGFPNVENMNASFAENFVDGWSELDSQSHVLQEQGSLDRLSKTAPGKAQNAPRSWYEDDEEGANVGGSAANGRAGSMTKDLSRHSSSSYPQGSAMQVAKAAKNQSKE